MFGVHKVDVQFACLPSGVVVVVVVVVVVIVVVVVVAVVKSVLAVVGLGRSPPAQAWKPSNHVCSKFGSPGSPQVSNQAPPREQQLGLPDLAAPHLAHVPAGECTVCVFRDG